MRDVSFPVRRAWIIFLANILPNVPVFDAKADNETGNYIILFEAASNNESTKDKFDYGYSLTIDIVTRFRGGGATSKIVDDISNTILSAMEPTPGVYGIAVDGFRVISLKAEAKPINAQFGGEHIIRKLLTINHLLTEE